ncbi:hypothetical protein [Rhodopirellula sallentina]|nr:hypothetical protein [Rhodopirellula sallentina]
MNGQTAKAAYSGYFCLEDAGYWRGSKYGHRMDWQLPTTFLSYLTFVPSAQRRSANHPMQPSGEVGRFEVDDQPSPPADR